jgi:hypothetical protein
MHKLVAFATMRGVRFWRSANASGPAKHSAVISAERVATEIFNIAFRF